jgi:hypothetical protein
MLELKRAVTAATMVCLLAGCAGTSQFAPAGNLNAQSTSALPPSPRGLANLNQTFLRAPQQKFYPFKKTKPGSTLAFVNDEGTQDVYVLDTATGDVVGTLNGVGGDGLAISPYNGQLAIGTLGPTISLWTVTTSGATSTGITLNLSSGFANGITYDSKGDLYATDYPSSNIDEFDAAVVSKGGSASRTYALPDLQYVYNVIASGTKVYAAGTAASGNWDIAELTKTGDKVLQSISGGSENGLALDKKQNLIINNNKPQEFEIFAKPYTGTPRIVQYQAAGPLSGIALNSNGTQLWTTSINFGGGSLDGDAQPFSYPELSEQTPSQTFGEEPISIALYPALKP